MTYILSDRLDIGACNCRNRVASSRKRKRVNCPDPAKPSSKHCRIESKCLPAKAKN